MDLHSTEIWRPVSFNHNYLVSNTGIVKSCDRYVPGKNGSKRFLVGVSLKPFVSSDGYLQVDIGRRTIKVHRLVAEAFIEKPLGKNEVNHKDRNRKNNCVDNLEWVTLQENQLHSWENGRIGNMFNRFGFDHNKSHAIIELVDDVVVSVYGSIKEAGRVLGVADCVIGQAIKRGRPISKRSHKLFGREYKKVLENGAF